MMLKSKILKVDQNIFEVSGSINIDEFIDILAFTEKTLSKIKENKKWIL